MNEFDDDLDQDVDNIISQLKNQSKSLKTVETDKPNLDKEDLEKFIIDNASEVVVGCVDMLQSLKIEVQAGGDPKLVESTATLVNAFTSALDALSKLKLSDDKIKAQKEIKEMDITAKLATADKESDKGVYISREDVIKGLLSYKNTTGEQTPPVIDV